jgi:hypothetical protein
VATIQKNSKPGYFEIGITRKPHILTVYQKLHQACQDWHEFFLLGSVDQCAVGMIEKRADIHVNPGGKMVTLFGYHCKQEGLGSNPGVTVNFFEHWNCKQVGPSANPGVTFFFFFFVWNKQHLPAGHHKQKIYHKLDYLIATCQFVPEIKALFPPKGYWMSPVLQLVITIPGLWLQIHALVGLTHCDQVGDLCMEYSW